MIEFHTNPDYSGDHPNADANVGPYLSLHLEESGQAAFFPEPEETYSLQSIELIDTSEVRLVGGHLHLTHDLVLGEGSTLRLHPGGLSADGAPLIAVGGTLDLAGTILLQAGSGDPLVPGTYTLFSYGVFGSLAGSVNAEALGMTAQLSANPDTKTVTLTLSASEAPQTWPAWQALHFTPEEIAQGRADPAADINGSGLANLLAYATGIDPHAPSSFSPLEIISEDGAPHRLRFPRNTNASDILLRLYTQSSFEETPTLLGESLNGQPFTPTASAAAAESALPDGRMGVEVTPLEPGARALYFLQVNQP
ncbi:MAG: hypothetical protein JJT96_07060 [Opitutales bacterium]|nr:hypothetical protein [Opitutales bacterium]